MRVAVLSLARMFDTWTLAVLGEMTRAAAISLFECPAETRRRTSSSLVVRPGLAGVPAGTRPAGELGDLRGEGSGAEPLGDRRGAAQPCRRLVRAHADWPLRQGDPGGVGQREGRLVRLPGRFPRGDGRVRDGQPAAVP